VLFFMQPKKKSLPDCSTLGPQQAFANQHPLTINAPLTSLRVRSMSG
jgi:hypothetical protein